MEVSRCINKDELLENLLLEQEKLSEVIKQLRKEKTEEVAKSLRAEMEVDLQKRQIAEFERKSQDQLKKIQTFEKQVGLLNNTLDQKSKEIFTLTQKLSKKESETTAKLPAVEALQTELDNKNKLLLNKTQQVSQLETRITALEKAINENKKADAAYKSAIEKLKKEIELKDKIHEEGKIEKAKLLTMLTTEKENYQKIVKNLDENKLQLANALKTMETKSNQVNPEVEFLKSENRRLNEVICKLKDEKSRDIKLVHADYENKIAIIDKKSQDTASQLKRKIEELQNQIDLLQKREDSDDDVWEITSQIGQLQKNKSSNSQKIAELEEKIKLLETENQSLKKLNEVANGKIKLLESKGLGMQSSELSDEIIAIDCQYERGEKRNECTTIKSKSS